MTEPTLFEGKDRRPLCLVGTIHLDVLAADTLFALLNRLRPECISVEISSFSVGFRKKHQKSWLKKLEELLNELPPGKRGHFRIRLLERQLMMPFEWETALRYARSKDVNLVPIDCGTLSRQELPRWESELLDIDNLLLATSEPDIPLDDYFSKHYQRAQSCLSSNSNRRRQFIGLVFDQQWCKREETLSKRLVNLCKNHRKVVHIGGWMHILRGNEIPSLADRTEPAVRDMFLITGHNVHKIQRSLKDA